MILCCLTGRKTVFADFVFSYLSYGNIFVQKQKDKNMKHSKHNHQREHHPATGIGLFFIVLGLSLLAATNDIFNLGGASEYFTWHTALIFIGILLVLNFRLTGGFLLIAIGTWFFLEHHYAEMPPLVSTFYWPLIIILLGLSFIITSLVRKHGNNSIN